MPPEPGFDCASSCPTCRQDPVTCFTSNYDLWYFCNFNCDCVDDGSGDFIGDACDSLVELYDNYFGQELDYFLKPKDRDALYYYFVDKFGNYLEKYFKDHKNKCS
jgi:hypothetical protein